MKVVEDINKARQTAISVMLITDDGTRNTLLPIELLQVTIEKINKEGEVQMLFSDGSRIVAKGLLIGSTDFYKERRVILLGSDLH